MPAGLSTITRYFPDITPRQKKQFESLFPLYEYWNTRINVISRKDLPFLYERHVLHALAIAKFIHFLPGTRIMDFGTGGGFPGVPLAIMFPDAHFDLVDSIAKKIRVVQEIVTALELFNVSAHAMRVEKTDGQYEFFTGRAVTALEKLWPWVAGKFAEEERHTVRNGLIYLKGGDLNVEVERLNRPVFVKEISDYFEETFFRTKKIVHIPRT